MHIESLTKFWPLSHFILQEFWSITEPAMEDAAIQLSIPVELYYYGELGLDSFSRAEFQKRNPYSNPLLYEQFYAF